MLRRSESSISWSMPTCRLLLLDADAEQLALQVDWPGYGIELAGWGAGAADAMLIECLQPDVLLIDMALVVELGPAFVSALRLGPPQLKLIALSSSDSFVYTQRAIQLGVMEYLLKPAPAGAALAAVLRARERLAVERTERLALRSQMLAALAGADAISQAHITQAALALERCRTLDEIRDCLGSVLSFAESQAAGQNSEPAPQRPVDMACAFIKQNLHRDISLDDVAGELHFSASYLASVFKKAIGKTVVEYITQLKMERAASLLRDPQAKIGRIAEALGYSDRRYFSELFRRYSSCTPSKYRERLLGHSERM